MNDILTPDQIADLAGISQICEEPGADLVVIGATSLLLLMGDLGRFTRDVDLTVALDFDEFERLTMRLAAIGWTTAPKLEHRWIAPRRTIIDLLPAGAELRRGGFITWPTSQFKMSLVLSCINQSKAAVGRLDGRPPSTIRTGQRSRCRPEQTHR